MIEKIYRNNLDFEKEIEKALSSDSTFPMTILEKCTESIKNKFIPICEGDQVINQLIQNLDNLYFDNYDTQKLFYTTPYIPAGKCFFKTDTGELRSTKEIQTAIALDLLSYFEKKN